MNECEDCDRSDCRDRGCIAPTMHNNDIMKKAMESSGMGKSNLNIKTKLDKLIQIQLELHQAFIKLQDQCDHSGDLRYEYCGSGDNYWINWHCIDCNKRWTTSQRESYKLTTLVFPNSIRIKN